MISAITSSEKAQLVFADTKSQNDRPVDTFGASKLRLLLFSPCERVYRVSLGSAAVFRIIQKAWIIFKRRL